MKKERLDVILYGLVDWNKKGFFVGEESIELADKYNVVGYSDSYSDISSYNNKPFFKRTELSNIKFDYIVIVLQRDIAAKIKCELSYFVPSDKILLLSDVYYSSYIQKVDRVLSMCDDNIEGVILGISHAVTGISSIPRFVNLAVRSQDIYYNIKSFKYYIEKSKANIKTVVFEMYDYNYLNFDISRSKQAFDVYYSRGGTGKMSIILN